MCVRQLADAGQPGRLRRHGRLPPDGPLAGWVAGFRARAGRRCRWCGRRARATSAIWPACAGSPRGADVLHLHASKAGRAGPGGPARPAQPRPRVVFTPARLVVAGRRLAGAGLPVFERATAPLADVIVAVSDDDRAVGLQVLSRSADRVVVIGNGVDTDRFAPDGPVADRRTGAAARVRRPADRGQGPAAGDRGAGPHADAGRAPAPGRRRRGRGDAARAGRRAPGSPSRVEFAGAVDDAAPHLRAADVVVVPSKWDAQSLVLLEAMACGAAILATRVPGSSAVERRRRDRSSGASRPSSRRRRMRCSPTRPARAQLGAAARRARRRALRDRALEPALGRAVDRPRRDARTERRRGDRGPARTRMPVQAGIVAAAAAAVAVAALIPRVTGALAGRGRAAAGRRDRRRRHAPQPDAGVVAAARVVVLRGLPDPHRRLDDQGDRAGRRSSPG